MAAIQIAKALGAKVIASASTAHKRSICSQYGADAVLDYSDTNWPAEARALAQQLNGKKGVDVIYDPVGKVDQSLKCIAWNGRILVIGFAGGNIEKVAMNRVLLKNVSLVGLHWGMYASMEPETVENTWKGIFELVEQGKFRPTVFSEEVFKGLDSVPRALKALGGRETWGKVVVEVDDDEEEAGRSKL